MEFFAIIKIYKQFSTIVKVLDKDVFYQEE